MLLLTLGIIAINQNDLILTFKAGRIYFIAGLKLNGPYILLLQDVLQTGPKLFPRRARQIHRLHELLCLQIKGR